MKIGKEKIKLKEIKNPNGGNDIQKVTLLLKPVKE